MIRIQKKIGSKGEQRIITKTRARTKSKTYFRIILDMITLVSSLSNVWLSQWQKYNTTKHLVDLYLKIIGKQVQGNKFEAHFNTRPTNIICSKDVPTKHDNEEIPPRGTIYWALMTWLWNFNPMTCLETQPNLHNYQQLDYLAIFILFVAKDYL